LGGRGEPDGGDEVPDFFQLKERMAAGSSMAAVSFGFKGARSIWSEIEQTKYIRRSACLK
jgi:hypothetical protein